MIDHAQRQAVVRRLLRRQRQVLKQLDELDRQIQRTLREHVPDRPHDDANGA